MYHWLAACGTGTEQPPAWKPACLCFCSSAWGQKPEPEPVVWEGARADSRVRFRSVRFCIRAICWSLVPLTCWTRGTGPGNEPSSSDCSTWIVSVRSRSPSRLLDGGIPLASKGGVAGEQAWPTVLSRPLSGVSGRTARPERGSGLGGARFPPNFSFFGRYPSSLATGWLRGN